ncbi:3623_t:CDS:2 [Paraglomus occultum]|uniref:DNA polymerase epsilon subunit D n=1 Tax=Paraglomus occultum TaxID=144539 RepID=A0A9N8YYF6_9GLOM|nr:3623_t:CDS:2 [Paraglomus occultum]
MVGIDELDLPAASITKVAKKALDNNALFQKDARMAVTKCTTVFISFLTNYSNESARSRGKKTITADDVIKGIQELGFDEFIPRMKDMVAGKRKKAT